MTEARKESQIVAIKRMIAKARSEQLGDIKHVCGVVLSDEAYEEAREELKAQLGREAPDAEWYLRINTANGPTVIVRNGSLS